MQFLAFAFLAAGLALTPSRLAAQGDAMPPETSAPHGGTAAASTVKPEADEPGSVSEEEKQNQAFRLEGSCGQVDREETLHISMEMSATIYEVLNFLIVASGAS